MAAHLRTKEGILPWSLSAYVKTARSRKSETRKRSPIRRIRGWSRARAGGSTGRAVACSSRTGHPIRRHPVPTGTRPVRTCAISKRRTPNLPVRAMSPRICGTGPGTPGRSGASRSTPRIGARTAVRGGVRTGAPAAIAGASCPTRSRPGRGTNPRTGRFRAASRGIAPSIPELHGTPPRATGQAPVARPRARWRIRPRARTRVRIRP